MDEGRTDQLVFFAFDLLFLNGKSTAQLPLVERKERLQRNPPPWAALSEGLSRVRDRPYGRPYRQSGGLSA